MPVGPDGVQPNGTVMVIGKLGDASPLKWATSITELPDAARVIPVYSEPVKLGFISGLLFASNTPGEDFVGPLAWKHPGTNALPTGFSAEVMATIGKFVPPAPTAPVFTVDGAAVRLIGPDFSPVNGQFTLDGKKIATEGNLKAFTINRTTGIFTRTMKNGTKSVKFSGAVNQAVNSGYGQFMIGAKTGKVDFIYCEAA